MRSCAALFAVLALAACATPAIQPPMTPPLGFTGSAVEAGGLRMDDGARLPLARWTPEAGEPWAVIIALHGMNDSRASFRLAGPWWAERGIETWAIDQHAEHAPDVAPRNHDQGPRGHWQLRLPHLATLSAVPPPISMIV